MPRSFRAALSDGHRAEREWVQRMRRDGFAVCHGKKLVLTKHDVTKDYCDTPDAGVLLTVELKERRLKFTCPEDYPYETVFVSATRSVGMASHRPFAVVFVSSVTKAWVWLCMLDKDATWTERTVHDSTRSHDMGMLVAPKSALRPAKQLMDYLVTHRGLEVVDGDATLFVTGGGAAEERERYVKKTYPSIRSRAGETDQEAHWDMG